MKKFNTKFMLIVFSIITVCIILSGLYVINIKNRMAVNFEDYLNQYKVDISNYIFNDNEEEYLQLINEAEIYITNKEIKKFSEQKEKLENFKENLLSYNKELIQSYTNKLESMDISILDDSDSIKNEIKSISNLIDENKFSDAKNKCLELEKNIIDKLKIKEEENKKIVIENNFNNLNGYWISHIDDTPINLRIDLKNNTYTKLRSVTASTSETIDSWEYNDIDNEYILTCSYKELNPFREIGQQVEYKLSYIDENHIKIGDILLYKVEFEQGIYHHLYNTLINSKYNDFSLYKDTLFFPKQYTINSEMINKTLSDDKIEEILLNNVYGQDRIEYCKKVAEIFDIDNFEVESMLRYWEEELISNIRIYEYNALTLKLPDDYEESNGIIGEAYYDDYCFSSGFILPNGIVIDYKRADDNKLEGLKSEILTYYE